MKKRIISIILVALVLGLFMFACSQGETSDDGQKYNIIYQLDAGENAQANPKEYLSTSNDIVLLPATKTGYNFAGWYKNSNFSSSSKLSVIEKGSKGNLTLYAKWQAVTYYVHFNANGGTGSMSDQAFVYDTAQYLAYNGFSYENHTFKGWNTKADGTGASYQNVEQVINIASTEGAIVQLYAQWQENEVVEPAPPTPETYTIILDNQGGTGGSASVSVMENSQMPTATAPTKEGYIFNGYYSQQNGGGKKYYNADMSSAKAWTNAQGATLYADWSAITYSIRFNANGGTGSMTDQLLIYDQTDYINQNGFSYENHTFKGWNTKADGSGISYQEAQLIKNLTTENGKVIDIYAQWQENEVVEPNSPTPEENEEEQLKLWREEIFAKYNKFYTFSLDDGVTQDERFIALLDKYNLTATFNVNTGLAGQDQTASMGGAKTPSGSLVTHVRMTEDKIKSGVYGTHEVASHTYSHPSLIRDVTDGANITAQVNSDVGNIENWTGKDVVGMAYPGPGGYRTWTCTNSACKKTISLSSFPDWCPHCGLGGTFNKNNTEIVLDFADGMNISASAIKHIKNNTKIKYGRTIENSHNFSLPRDFMVWNPTCSFKDASLLTYAENFKNLKTENYGLFYVWGHTYEFDMADPTNSAKNDWDRIESFLKYMSEIEDAICLTNSEVYKLFADKILSGATKFVTMSFDDGTTYDEQIASALNENDLRATFFINSGLLGQKIDGLNNVTRLSEAEIESALNGGFYYGHDISSHGYTHAPGGFAVDGEINPNWTHPAIINEMNYDLENIKTITGKKPLGCAYPGGATYLCEEVINVIKYYTDIKFARYTGDTYQFNIPNDWMMWQPTCEVIANGSVGDLFNQFLSNQSTDYQLFYLWDHPWAVVQNGCLDEFKDFCSAVNNAKNEVACLTNTEFYKLFANSEV